MTWQRVKIEISKEHKPSARIAIGSEIVQRILERTLIEGKDKDGKRFSKYEKDYAKRKGVGVGDVDLNLTSEMLDNLKLLSHRSGQVIIGFDKGDTKLNGKVEGNRKGTYGQPKPIPGKARDFLGIQNKDLKKIEKEFKVTDKKEKDLIKKAAEKAIREGIVFSGS